MNKQTYQTMIGTAESMGVALTESALLVLAGDLEHYSDASLVQAFKLLRQSGARFNTSEIINRLPGMWPGPEEAWATFPRHDWQTACITPEMLDAWEVAKDLDPIPGRVAFKEAYIRAITISKSEGKTPSWFMSLGDDKDIREQAILSATEKGLITVVKANVHLPHFPIDQLKRLAQKNVSIHALQLNHQPTINSVAQLAAPAETETDMEKNKAEAAKLRELFTTGTPA